MPRTRKSILKPLILGLLVAAAFTLVAMLILAIALVYLRFNDEILTWLNQLIKVAAIVLGVTAAVPRGSQRGLVTGVLIAIAYMIIGYGLYILLGGHAFSITAALGELLLGAAVGAVTGALRANMTSRNRRRVAAV